MQKTFITTYSNAKRDYLYLRGGAGAADTSTHTYVSNPSNGSGIIKSLQPLADQSEHPLSKKYIDVETVDQNILPIIQRPVPNVNIIMCTHNARLRCFLEDVLGDLMKAYRTQKNVDEIRLKNCCVLKLDLSNGSPYAMISLEYEGDVQNRKAGAYFVSPKKDRSLVPVDDVEFVPISFSIEKLGLKSDQIQRDYHIYMIRHGEAEHNLKGSLHLKKDTLLTSDRSKSDDGIRQTLRAAAELKTLLGRNKVEYAFCSELKRTRQTLSLLMRTIGIKTKMIVLPCSSELKYSDQGRCDSINQGFFSIIPAENKEVCSQNPKGDMCSVIDQIPVDWTHYNKFFKIDKKNCSNRTMIQNIFDIITN